MIIVIADETPADSLAAAALSDPSDRSTEPLLQRSASADPLFDPIGGCARVDTEAAPISVTRSAHQVIVVGGTGAPCPSPATPNSSRSATTRCSASPVPSGTRRGTPRRLLAGIQAELTAELEGELNATVTGEFLGGFAGGFERLFGGRLVAGFAGTLSGVAVVCVAVFDGTFSGGEGLPMDIIVARADDYPNALAAGPLAAVLNAPILLNPTRSLDAAMAAEIERLGKLGGGCSDALVAGGFIANLDGPLLLTRADSLTAVTATYLNTYVMNGDRIFTFGGPDALKAAAKARIAALLEVKFEIDPEIR